MPKFLICLFLSFMIFPGIFAQKDSTDKYIMDSLIQNDEFLKMLNDIDKSVSYLKVSAGIGNSLLNGNNGSLKSLQNIDNIIFKPSIEYFHKSGFGISLTGYLLNENSETNFYQYTVSPYYEYTKSKVIGASMYYTHYFVRDVFNITSSPIQDDFYGSMILKNTFIKPGISFGYSSGKSDEIIKIDTVLKIQNQIKQIKYIDTVNILLNSYSISPSIEHEFDFYELFSSEDELSFVPQFSVISGINNYKVTHNSSLSNYNAFTKKKIKKIRHFYTQSGNKKWQMQSLGLDLDLNYYIGKFSFEPDVYLDYYLPKTIDKKFTQIFNFNIGMTF